MKLDTVALLILSPHLWKTTVKKIKKKINGLFHHIRISSKNILKRKMKPRKKQAPDQVIFCYTREDIG